MEQAVSTAHGLYARWKDLFNNQATFGNPEYEWTTTELQNSLKSIEWDLEDLGMSLFFSPSLSPPLSLPLSSLLCGCVCVYVP